MKKDIVDELLDQWATERPKMNVSSLGVVVRVQMLAKLLQQRTAAALDQHNLKHWEYDVLSVLRRQGEPFELPATEIADAFGDLYETLDATQREQVLAMWQKRRLYCSHRCH